MGFYELAFDNNDLYITVFEGISCFSMPGYLDFYQMSYMWYSAFAVFVTTASGLIVSFATGQLTVKLWLHAQFLHAIILDSGRDF